MGAGQTTDTVLMIRPNAFGRNAEAEDNIFSAAEPSGLNISELARQEFDHVVRGLRTAGIQVLVFDDLMPGVSPDAVFPNNWFSTHVNGEILLYPMRSPLRRQEVRSDIIAFLQAQYGFKWVLDWTGVQGGYLEGTGSLVLDREHQIAYAALSERTHRPLLEKFSQTLNYQVVSFDTADPWRGLPIYHTNVLLSIGPAFAVICSEVILDPLEREGVLSGLEKTGKTCLEITPQQMQAFAGNLLALHNSQGEPLIVCSEQAFQSLTDSQRRFLANQGECLAFPLSMIERFGGGSMRCMLAEIFSPD